MIRRSVLFILSLIVVTFEISSVQANEHQTVSFQIEESRQTLSREDYSAALDRAVMGQGGFRVREFQWIREQARRMGIRVWIYGGTAATFANHVRKTQGQGQESKLTQLFFDDQDFDLIVDGDVGQLKEFTKRLMRKFSYNMGHRPRWDVALFHEAIGNHASLDSGDVSNQHSDSWSTGLIELTDPPNGQFRVLDMRDRGVRYSRFFEDIRTGQIRFYYSDKHKTTARAREGRNPEIMSVIRFFTKVFSFGPSFSEADMKPIAQIIQEFDPGQTYGRYVHNWLKYNVRKMVYNAQEPVKALNFLVEIGLLQKLAVMGDPEDAESFVQLLTGDCSHLFRR